MAIAMMLFPLVLVLAQALAIQANVVPSDIEALCRGAKGFEVTNTSQLRDLAKLAPFSKCPNFMKAAIVELATIVTKDSENLCATDAIDTMRYFYTQYMDNASIKEDHKTMLPEGLKNFAIAYGLQMSNKCKMEMIRVLSEDAHNLLEPSDFKTVEQLISDDGPLAGLLKSLGEADEIFLPADLAPIMNRHGAQQGTTEKVFLQTITVPWIRRIQNVCEHRFRPIYEPLMIPITRLTYMGFNYKDEPLKCELECPRSVHELGQWSRIVLLCESLASIHIVEVPESKELTEGTDVSQVKIITKEEAATIEGAQPVKDDNPLPIVHYEQRNEIKLGDLVLDKSNPEFAKMVKSFKVGESEVQLFKRHMLDKGMRFLKRQLKKGNLSFLVSSAYKSLTNKDTKSAGSFIVKTFDEIVSNKQANGEGNVALQIGGLAAAGASTVDGPLMGWTAFFIYGLLTILGVLMCFGLSALG